jgi:hypothetical protein
MDGDHRIAKAWLAGMTEIKAVQCIRGCYELLLLALSQACTQMQLGFRSDTGGI